MNCQQCDELWDQLLDQESSIRAGLALDREQSHRELGEREQAAHIHTLTCARCRQARVRYETLRQALRAWLSSPRPQVALPHALLERVLAEQKRGSTRIVQRWWAALSIGAAAVAACLLLGFAAQISSRLQHADTKARSRLEISPGGEALRRSSRQNDSRVLSEALADATDATWDLARRTSEPAARLGRQVLESATGPDAKRELGGTASSAGSPYAGFDSLAEVFPAMTLSPEGTSRFQQLEDGLSASLRPLSLSARQAFGFLRIPSLERSRTSPNRQAASKGA